MNQMTAPNAPVLRRMPYNDIASAFFREGRDGRIFFAFSRGDRAPTLHFPVLADGTISNHDGWTFWPDQEVALIHPKDLGIADIHD